MSSNNYVEISRPSYTQESLDRTFRKKIPHEESVSEKIGAYCREQCQCSASCLGNKALSYLPFINQLRNYKVKEYLVPDIVSGLSVGIIHIPQGMGLLFLLPSQHIMDCVLPSGRYCFISSSVHPSIYPWAPWL